MRKRNGEPVNIDPRGLPTSDALHFANRGEAKSRRQNLDTKKNSQNVEKPTFNHRDSGVYMMHTAHDGRAWAPIVEGAGPDQSETIWVPA